MVAAGAAGTSRLDLVHSPVLSTAAAHLMVSIDVLGPAALHSAIDEIATDAGSDIHEAIDGSWAGWLPGWQPWWGVGPVMPPDTGWSPASPLLVARSPIHDLVAIVEQLIGGDSAVLDALRGGFQTVVAELGQGTSLAQALSDAGSQILDGLGGTAGQVIQYGLEQLSKVVSAAETIAPAVISGAQTVASALLGTVNPVVDAVKQAVDNVNSALHTGDLPKAVAAGLASIADAVDNGIHTMATAVHSAWQGVEDALSGDHLLCGGCFNPGAATASNAAGTANAIVSPPDTTPKEIGASPATEPPATTKTAESPVDAGSDHQSVGKDVGKDSGTPTGEPGKHTGAPRGTSQRAQRAHAPGKSTGSSAS